MQPPPPNPYGAPLDLSADDLLVKDNRDPELGQPVGKGDPSVPPILLAKMSRGQEIELVCKAYKVGPILPSRESVRLKRDAGYCEVSRQVVAFVDGGIRI